MYIVKYDPAGNALWAKHDAANLFSRGISIGIDNYGNSYITGLFYGNLIIGSTTLASTGVEDIFISKFSQTGIPLWGIRAGGPSKDVGSGVAVSKTGNCYLTGSFQNSGNFGNINLGNVNGAEFFIAKLDHVTEVAENIDSGFSIFPNPFTSQLQFHKVSGAQATITLTDMLGQEVHRQQTTGSTDVISPTVNLSSGMYLLQVQQGENIYQQRVVKQ